MSKTQNTIRAAALAGGWTLVPDGYGSSPLSPRFDRRGRVVVVNFTRGGAVHSARIYTEGVSGKPPRNAEYVHPSFTGKAAIVVGWLDDGMPDADASQPASATQSDEQAAPVVESAPASTDHVCGYSDGNRVPPCEDPAPNDASYCADHEIVAAARADTPGEWVPTRYDQQFIFETDDFSAVAMRRHHDWQHIWSVRNRLTGTTLSGMGHSIEGVKESAEAYMLKQLTPSPRGKAQIEARSNPGTWIPFDWDGNRPPGLELWTPEYRATVTRLRDTQFGWSVEPTATDLLDGVELSGTADSIEGARHDAEQAAVKFAEVLRRVNEPNPHDQGWSYSTDVEVNDDEPNIAVVDAAHSDDMHAVVSVVANEDGSLAVLVVAQAGVTVHVSADTDRSDTEVGALAHTQGVRTTSVTYSWF